MLTPLRVVYGVVFLAVCWCVAGVAQLLVRLVWAERRPL
jgi:hypothetical protein